ncbi:CocE/NonD family hydrolase [Sphingomonas sp. PAMC 26621]|uniref:CocE/NonD family hydrolase n=1 Tax=Sphingomonas sp. PAMC 26621 TaxID=1112213 RepID=UPI000287E403|nr:CocE/NonD family hydrolase [Sphingomonas sp. PAMC 26621]
MTNDPNDGRWSRWALARRFLRNAFSPNVIVTPAPSDLTAEWNVPVRVRDGTMVRVNVFRPAAPGGYPVIMSAHPYGKDQIPAKTRSGRGLPFQARVLSQPRPIRYSEWTSWEAPDPVFWASNGYVVVNADLRGGGTSEGTAELISDQEAEDYYDLIKWAVAQPWSSGRIGLDGVSYLAISQYKVAALHPPGLAAICPWEGLTDLYRDFARPGGVREDGFSKLWSNNTAREARVSGSLNDEIVARPERDGWYVAATPRIEDIAVPILVCGSFSDHLLHTRGSFELFRRAGSEQKWLYTHRDGKWAAYYGEEATRTRLRFFDYFLKSADNGWGEEPPVRLAIYEAGAEPAAVTREDAWPPCDLRWRSLNLDAAHGTLGETEQGVAEAVASFDAPNGVASFVWTVPEDMDVIGPMALSIAVELVGVDDLNLFVTARKIVAGREVTFEGSYGYGADSVSKGWQRVAHRMLDSDLSTPLEPVHRHDRAEPAAPGEIVPIVLSLRPHATRFRRGDRLRLDISGRWPRSRNLLFGQFPAGYQHSEGGTCRLHTGGSMITRLLIGTRSVGSQAVQRR